MMGTSRILFLAVAFHWCHLTLLFEPTPILNLIFIDHLFIHSEQPLLTIRELFKQFSLGRYTN